MKIFREFWISCLLLILMILSPVLVFSRLPELVPIHWNRMDVVDGWAPRAVGAFFLPTVACLILAFAMLAPRWSAQSFSMQPFARIYPTLVAATEGTLLYLSVLLLRLALGVSLNVRMHVSLLTGLLLIVAGNYLGKTTRNSFVGIRTP